MNAPNLERFLARLYTDAALRERFLAEPVEVALEVGLDAEAARAFARIDREGLVLAADSFERKRQSRG